MSISVIGLVVVEVSERLAVSTQSTFHFKSYGKFLRCSWLTLRDHTLSIAKMTKVGTNMKE